VHNERGKSDCRSDCKGRFDGDGRKHDVPDNPVTMNCDERKFRIENPGIPQGIYETCFVIMSKRLVVYLKNSGNICWSFRPDKKGIHPVLLDGWADKGDVLEKPVLIIVS
jgi:hypothetical protein